MLSKLAVAGTILGHAEATKYLISNQIRTAETDVLINRMRLREGYQTTGVQRLGRVADALHYALSQSLPEGPGQEAVIRVFPAWPEEWDTQYTLLCRGGFLVTSSIQEGKIEFAEILSQKGGQCRLRNPWPETEVVLYRNGKKQKKLNGTLFIFDSQQEDRFVIVPEGVSPEQLK